jgi:hypothetical protein
MTCSDIKKALWIVSAFIDKRDGKQPSSREVSFDRIIGTGM